MTDDTQQDRPVSSTIPGVEPGETVRTTHRAPFLTRGSEERYNQDVAQATRDWDELRERY